MEEQSSSINKVEPKVARAAMHDNEKHDMMDDNATVTSFSNNTVESATEHFQPYHSAEPTDWDWEVNKKADDENDDVDDECCSLTSDGIENDLVPKNASLSSSSSNEWILPPVVALGTQVVSLSLFSSPTTASLEHDDAVSAALYWPMVYFNIIVVATTAWLLCHEHKRQQRQQHQRQAAQNSNYLLICLPEILMSLTTVLFLLGQGTFACCTLFSSALGLSLLIVLTLLNLVGTQETPTRRTSACCKKAAIPRMISFETTVN